MESDKISFVHIHLGETKLGLAIKVDIICMQFSFI